MLVVGNYKQCCLIVWIAKRTESKNAAVVKVKNRRIMNLSICVVAMVKNQDSSKSEKLVGC